MEWTEYFNTCNQQESISKSLFMSKNDEYESMKDLNMKDDIDKEEKSNAEKKVSSLINIKTFQYDINTVNLHSEFQIILKKYETVKEDEKENQRKIINVFGIFLECNKQILNKLFAYDSELSKFNFYFYHKGRTKEISLRKDKKEKKFNFFELLLKAYYKFLNVEYIVSNPTIDLNDILYDISGLPIIEFDLRNKFIVNKLISDMKSLCELDNCTILLVNDEDFESPQFCFEVLSTYELNICNSIKLDGNIVDSKSREDTETEIFNSNNQNNLSGNNNNNNLLLKLRRFNLNINLKTLYDYIYLLEDQLYDIQQCKELYPTGNSNYTYISLNEIFSNFNRLIVIENTKFEQQINGKFIKCIRDDNIVEYKSRWIYSFNVTSDNFEVTLGIHQNIPNTASTTITYIYIGLVILKSNMSMLNFIDYLPLKDYRQNFIKLKLTRGSYVVVPM